MTSYKNILVIQTAFIGDAILASSLVEKLHSIFPGAAISILVRKGNEQIYQDHPFLKEVLTWNKKENKIPNLFALLTRLRKNKFDCVINCHRFASSGFLTAFSGARHTAGYKQNPLSFLFNHTVKHTIGDGRHEIDRYNQLIEDFADTRLDLRPSKTGNQDIIGNSYEYLIANFASDAGKKGGEFYTPAEVATLLAKLLQPRNGDRICDPACGSGSLLIKVAREISSKNYSLYGQESNGSTWALCKMNMFLHEKDNARIEWG
ncbi:MAG TPA: N-6 DNA methylase, partial [Bacteroidia bacterium]|nr:N-6 DNA methylase [Bacteroidia bacterium]